MRVCGKDKKRNIRRGNLLTNNETFHYTRAIRLHWIEIEIILEESEMFANCNCKDIKKMLKTFFSWFN